MDLLLRDDPTARRYVEPVEHLRRRYGEVGIPADNAGALTGKDMRKLPGRRGRGRVYIAPAGLHSPTQPHQAGWREIKAAAANIFLDGLEKTLTDARRMIRNGEMPAWSRCLTGCRPHGNPTHLG